MLTERKTFIRIGIAATVVVTAVVTYVTMSGSSPSSRVGAQVLQACPAPANWASEGTTLLQQQETSPSTNETPSGTVIQTPFAYPSMPVDVSGDGVYTFDFGPLKSNFNWPTDPFGFGLKSPDNFTGGIQQQLQSSPSVVQINGSNYFQLHVDITNAACTGLILWIS
jgi:hypothetical protein